VTKLATGYEPDRHGMSSGAYAQQVDADFIDRFAVVGDAPAVTERLLALGEAGVDRIVVVPGSIDADRDAMRRANERFAEDVLPALG